MKSIVLALAMASGLPGGAGTQETTTPDFMATSATLQDEVLKAQAETRAAQNAIDAGDTDTACTHLHAAYSGMDTIIVLADTYAAQLDARDDYTEADKQALFDEVNSIRANVVTAQGDVGGELKDRCGTAPQ